VIHRILADCTEKSWQPQIPQIPQMRRVSRWQGVMPSTPDTFPRIAAASPPAGRTHGFTLWNLRNLRFDFPSEICPNPMNREPPDLIARL
jgi:hypothetical protein